MARAETATIISDPKSRLAMGDSQYNDLWEKSMGIPEVCAMMDGFPKRR